MEHEEHNHQIEELQILEQGFQNILMQKQTIQLEVNEISNAFEELKTADDEVYKVLGGIMIKADKQTLSKELAEKKKLLELRVSTIEKQEKIIDDKIQKLRQELTESFSKEKN